MAAKLSATFTRAAIAVLVLLAFAIGSLQSAPGVEADDEGALAGEWVFWISFQSYERKDFPFTYGAFVTCIASIADTRDGWHVPMYCDSGLGYVDFTASFDKASGAIRLQGPLWTLMVDAEGMFETDGFRSTIEAMYELETGTGTFDGHKERGPRGVVRCNKVLIGPARDNFGLSAVDAQLVLQHVADLHTANCMHFGDVDLDRDVDSIDASLILQLVGGAIDHFPP